MGRDESGFLGRISRAGWDESAARGPRAEGGSEISGVSNDRWVTRRTESLRAAGGNADPHAVCAGVDRDGARAASSRRSLLHTCWAAPNSKRKRPQSSVGGLVKQHRRRGELHQK
jgi:hypothetical protein